MQSGRKSITYFACCGAERKRKREQQQRFRGATHASENPDPEGPAKKSQDEPTEQAFPASDQYWMDWMDRRAARLGLLKLTDW
jgi:hypothetical protein